MNTVSWLAGCNFISSQMAGSWIPNRPSPIEWRRPKPVVIVPDTRIFQITPSMWIVNRSNWRSIWRDWNSRAFQALPGRALPGRASSGKESGKYWNGGGPPFIGYWSITRRAQCYCRHDISVDWKIQTRYPTGFDCAPGYCRNRWNTAWFQNCPSIA